MYSANARHLKLHSPILDQYSIMLTDIEGVESLSSPFHFKVEMFSSRDIDTSTILGKSATIEVATTSSSKRYFNGLIAEAVHGPKSAANNIHYQLTIVPCFWFLTLDNNYVRFENKSVIDIFNEVCHSLNVTGYDTSQLTKEYPKYPFQVQSDESSYDFLSRLLADNNIDYYFEHTNGQHTMVLVDSYTHWLNPRVLNYATQLDQQSTVYDWQHQKQLITDAVTIDTYDYHNPSVNQLLSKQMPIVENDVQALETYHFPSGMIAPTARKLSLSQKIEKREASRDTIMGKSHCAALMPGKLFDLQSFPVAEENQQYVLISVRHYAQDHSHIASEHQDTQFYHNDFTCLPFATSMTTPTEFDARKATGSQSARVEGSVQNKLNASGLAEVKTTFFWQHEKTTKPTTHWQRVLQPFAGKNWGMQFLPRTGDEVIIRYLYGDPNSPIIIGSLHNAEKLPYFTLPKEQTQSGIVTRTVNSKNIDSSHKLIFNDTKNKELLTLVSSRDMQVTVKQNMTTTIMQDVTHNVHGKVEVIANAKYTINAKQSIKLEAGGSSIEILPHQINVCGSKILLGGAGSGSSSPVVAAETAAVSAIASSGLRTRLMKHPDCTLQQFLVSCTHGNRAFKIDTLHTKPMNKQGQYLLQVIASDTQADRIKVELKGASSNCPSHKSSQPQFLLTGPNAEKTHIGSDIVNVYGTKNKVMKHDFITFFKDILLPISDPNVYTITPQSCDNQALPVIIEAYAPVKWKGHIGVEYDHEKQEPLEKEASPEDKLRFRDKWKSIGEIDINRNNTDWTLGNDDDDDDDDEDEDKNTEKATHLFSDLQAFSEHVMPLFGSIKDLVNINMNWPKVTLSGEIHNAEDVNKPTVGLQGQIKLACDPLIGIEADTDIINWLLYIAGDCAFGKYLVDIKERIAQGVGVDGLKASATLEVVLKASANIQGDLQWTRPAGSEWHAGGEIQAPLDISIKGRIAGSLDVFIITAAAGVDLAVKSGITVKMSAGLLEDEDNSLHHHPALQSQLQFNGLTVYWAAYFKIKARSITKSELSDLALHKIGCKSSNNLVSDAPVDVEIQKYYQNKFIVLEEKSWPSIPKMIKLNDLNKGL